MGQETLLMRARRFDHVALAELHDQLYPVVYRYVRFRLDDDQTSEDISSEVFVRFLQALRQPGRPIEDARAWMLGTASNLVHDHYRLKYRRPLEYLDDHESLVSPQVTEGVVERRFTMDELRVAMQQLTLDQQAVLALRFTQELSLEETAQIVGKSVNAVKVLQFRALAALRRLLAEGTKE
ncbi:MAG: sigma-70 family RNA polymerase sigma factor [Methanothrix sp.]|nr:sigma-70 family RNA polymerase sigma factor [Methanothrix sp.]